MSLTLQLLLIVSILVYMGIIIWLLTKKALILQYSLIWLIVGAGMLFSALFPNAVIQLSHFLGFELAVNAVFLIEGMFEIMLLIYLSCIVSRLYLSQRTLIQNISILENRIRVMESTQESMQQKNQCE